MTPSRGEPLDFARKLQRLCQLNEDRVWIAHYWQDVSKTENPGDGIAPLWKLLNRHSARMVSEFTKLSPEEIVENLRRVTAAEGFHEATRNFVLLCEAYTAWVREQGAELLAVLRSETSCIEYIRQPALFVDGIVKELPRFQSDAGRAQLAVFPDVYAAARHSRLVAYYAIQHALGSRKKFENNWDDASYAFVASYTGLLATTDNGMIGAANTVFPNVKIWDRISL